MVILHYVIYIPNLNSEDSILSFFRANNPVLGPLVTEIFLKKWLTENISVGNLKFWITLVTMLRFSCMAKREIFSLVLIATALQNFDLFNGANYWKLIGMTRNMTWILRSFFSQRLIDYRHIRPSVQCTLGQTSKKMSMNIEIVIKLNIY